MDLSKMKHNDPHVTCQKGSNVCGWEVVVVVVVVVVNNPIQLSSGNDFGFDHQGADWNRNWKTSEVLQVGSWRWASQCTACVTWYVFACCTATASEGHTSLIFHFKSLIVSLITDIISYLTFSLGSTFHTRKRV